jgi:hypothetical protein
MFGGFFLMGNQMPPLDTKVRISMYWWFSG